MTTPTSRQATQRILTAFLLTGTVACSQQAIGQGEEKVIRQATIFECVNQDRGWVTKAKRGNSVSVAPLFDWSTTEFGDEWTPEKRCHHVSGKLTQVVLDHGGRLEDVTLTTGVLDNGYTVACFLTTSEETCNPNNQLFTLSQKNAKNPAAVLAKITNSAYGFDGEKTIYENGTLPQYVSLKALVDNSLGQ